MIFLIQFVVGRCLEELRRSDYHVEGFFMKQISYLLNTKSRTGLVNVAPVAKHPTNMIIKAIHIH